MQIPLNVFPRQTAILFAGTRHIRSVKDIQPQEFSVLSDINQDWIKWLEQTDKAKILRSVQAKSTPHVAILDTYEKYLDFVNAIHKVDPDASFEAVDFRRPQAVLVMLKDYKSNFNTGSDNLGAAGVFYNPQTDTLTANFESAKNTNAETKYLGINIRVIPTHATIIKQDKQDGFIVHEISSKTKIVIE